MKKIGEKLEEFRRRAFKDMGLRRVANEIGVDYSYLFNVEKGEHKPSDEFLAKLSDAYKLSPEEKADLFFQSHMTPQYREVIENKKVDMEKILAFYRKNKK